MFRIEAVHCLSENIVDDPKKVSGQCRMTVKEELIKQVNN